MSVLTAVTRAAQAILAHRRKYRMLAGQVSGNWYMLELGRLEGALYEALAAKPK